ncbi:MAG TPA: S1/P1 nuclease [Steroidobacteraceae bacterium]|nr:S1/P1 nuclease [Steroidobacteraceae bacterium]
MTLAVLAACAALACPRAEAWSGLGHQLVGELAQRLLTPAAEAQVSQLLQGEPQPTLGGVASWADWLRTTDPERFKATARWHYVNIAPGTCRYRARRDCPDGACVVGAIEAQQRLLVDASQPLDVRRDALKFIVHFVGDVHQPLHSSNHSDQGANQFAIRLRTDIPPEEYARDRYHDGVMDTNLHAVWDYYVLASAGLNPSAYAERLAAALRPAARRQRSAASWAAESCKSVRGLYPASHELDGSYLAAMRPLAERRIVAAAERLAGLLNAAFPAADSSSNRP